MKQQSSRAVYNLVSCDSFNNLLIDRNTAHCSPTHIKYWLTVSYNTHMTSHEQTLHYTNQLRLAYQQFKQSPDVTSLHGDY